MTVEDLIALQNELCNLIQNHQKILEQSDNNNMHNEKVEATSLYDAALLADRIEELNDRMNMIERQCSDKRESSSSTKQTTNSHPAHESQKKLEFLNMFRIEPKYLHDGLPTNRKSKRKAVPKSSYQTSAECKANQSQLNVKRKIVKKRTLERPLDDKIPKNFSPLLPNFSMSNTSPANTPPPQGSAKPMKIGEENLNHLENYTDDDNNYNNSEPYSTENSSLPSTPNRFITEITVHCNLCHNPFIVHQVGDSFAKTKKDSESICFLCQVRNPIFAL
uniref:Uncharacterized protein n=1 Tax=Romanomermis culicivorax TaxID=13658 RepID=A0A915L1F0_ROMCU